MKILSGKANLPDALYLCYCYITNVIRWTAWKKTKNLKRPPYILKRKILEALEEAALDLRKETGMKWSKGAVIRLALSDFFTRRGSCFNDDLQGLYGYPHPRHRQI